MELIYLWIKKYKNIENQGFNFSPRFDCHFDSDNLTIEEKKHTSIFPDNINITAIVGENGSGKSSVLEFLMNCFIMEYNDYSPKNFILLYKYEKKLKFFTSGIHINNLSNLKDTFAIEEQINFLLNKDDGENEGHESLFALAINNEYTEPKSRHTSQFINENSKKTLREINTLIIQNSLSLAKEFQKTEKYFIPTKLVVKIKQINSFTSILNKDREFYKNEIWDEITQLIKELKDTTFAQKIELIRKIFKIKSEKFQLIEKDRFNLFSETKDERYFKNTYKDFSKELPKKIKDNTSINDEFIINISDIDQSILNFFIELPYEFDIELMDENKSFHELSFGERQLLIQTHTILKYILEKKYYTFSYDYEGEERIYGHNINEIVIFLDEFEIGLHPNWQKKFISYFREIYEITDKKIHLIITSHSPFLLSDLPKENVVFIKNGEQKNPFKEKKQTFGANIHTLLSHGFFMEDGLMGEFAKEKIEDIKKFYEDNKYLKQIDDEFQIKKDEFEEKKDYFNHIKSIIGEPFLQTIIKNYLDELEIIFNGKKEFLNNEIKRLENMRSQLDD